MSQKSKLVLALLGMLLAGDSARAGGVVFIGGGPPHHHHHHGYYGRPVYARRVYPQPYVYEVPVYVDRPVYVERQVVVERPVVVQRPVVQYAPAAKTTVPATPVRQAQDMQPVLPEPTSSDSLKLVPIGPNNSPPAPNYGPPPQVVQNADVPPIEFKGELPPGETTDFTIAHPKTGIHYTFPVPACEPERIDPGKWETEIEYDNGEIEVEFKRDGSIKVKYEFDDD